MPGEKPLIRGAASVAVSLIYHPVNPRNRRSEFYLAGADVPRETRAGRAPRIPDRYFDFSPGRMKGGGETREALLNARARRGARRSKVFARFGTNLRK